MQSKSYDVVWVKELLVLSGIVLVLVGAVMFIATPLRITVQQDGRINTYLVQARQAVTPTQFAAALRKLDIALQREGMVEGNAIASFMSGGGHGEMAYKREQYRNLASRAEALASLEVTSTMTSTGLAEMKATVAATPTNSYSFWVWRQGGAWWQLYWPAILVGTALATWIAVAMMPDYIRYTARAKGATS